MTALTEREVVLTGDAREVMATLPANSFDAMLCDPPYGLRFMGKAWDYDLPSVGTWRSCRRG